MTPERGKERKKENLKMYTFLMDVRRAFSQFP
jgi:hypothetical protein